MKCIIYGKGALAEYAAYVLDHDSEYTVEAFCVEDKYMDDERTFYNQPVVSFETVQDLFSPEEYEMFIAVGDNDNRRRLFFEAKAKGYKLLTYVSSKSITWPNVELGENVFVTEPSVIQPFCKLGDNNILFGAQVGHHSVVGCNNLLSSCILSGNVTVGHNCFIGLNSSIKQNVSIADYNIIGMNCTIVKNTAPYSIYSNKGTVKSSVSSEKLSSKYLR